MGEGGRDEKVGSSKRKPKLKTKVQKSIPFMTKMAAKWLKMDTQFMTKTAEKAYPLGPHIPI